MTRSGAARRTGRALALAAALSLLGAASAFATPIVQELPDSPFSAGTTNPGTVAFNPSGALVAAANGNGSVSVLSVAPGGALTPVAGSPFHIGSAVSSATFSPDGSLLAVADPNANAVDVLSVSAGGALTPIAGSPFPTGSGSVPTFVTFSPDGQLLAAADHGDSSVSVFSVSTGGALTPVDGSPYATGAGSLPFALAFSPDGTRLAIADSGTDNISMFSVPAAGALSEVTGSPFTTGAGSQPLSVAFSANGGLLASANSNGNSLSIFTVSNSGALSPTPGSPHAIGRGPRTLAFGSEGLLAVANYFSSTMSVFSVSADGELTEISGSQFPTGYLTTSLAFSPNGGLLAAVSLFSQDIRLFAVGAPIARVDSPAAGGFYAQNQAVPTEFSCSDAPGERGIGSCADSTGAVGSADTGSGSTGSGTLDTSIPGKHTYTVTATSSNTRTTVARIAYTVAGPAAGANWTFGAQIPQARYAAAAAPLGNGDVLVAGGIDSGGNVTSDSEIYHPSTNTWTRAAALQSAGYGAAAATLGNGDVLVTGGLDANNNLSWDSEIYDPSTDSWTQVQGLSTPRSGAVAATLPNGDVLVTGGSDGNTSLSVSEIYHPSNDYWTSAAGLPTARDSASGAVLGNGDVLVTGGNDGNNQLSDSEIYHPSTDSWTRAADLPHARDRAAAAPLASGGVLVTGGYTSDSGTTSDTEIYDPGSDSWTRAADVPRARYQAVAAPLPHGGVLVAGGFDGSTGTLADVEISAAGPSSTGSPRISGTAVAGQTLSVSNGSWSGWSALTYSYQWYRCQAAGSTNCAPIDGAAAARYTLTAADVGHQVNAGVTATDQDNHSGQAVAWPVGPVGQASPSNSSQPTITGTPQDGQKLYVHVGSWVSWARPLVYSYQWQRCDLNGGNCTPVSSQTSSSYRQTAADVGHDVTVTVTATDQQSQTGQASAPKVAVGNPPAPSSTTLPTITGTSQDGQKLLAHVGSWLSPDKPLAYSYQWQRCDPDGSNCADIPGATAASFALTSVDVGHELTVTVTSTDLEAQSAGATASPAGPIAAPAAPSSIVQPTITGTTQDGQKLLAHVGSWLSPDKPLAYSYQWQRCNPDGSNCANITGATASSYRQTAADVALMVTVTVTASDRENQPGQATAAPVGPVDAPPVPSNAIQPTITGTAQSGQKLYAHVGSWLSPDQPLGYSYQWQRCDSGASNCGPIDSRTASSYRLTAADVGFTVTVTVTATDTENQRGQATATPVATITG